ncbi:MAG: 50S ribosome-binding GTPase [Kiritimatiellae bacterium]|nr:50S ribosome-binding GTPase [Kiritimatiellia bacterium]
MALLNETPQANRVRIAFFGLRNAGKSTLVNAFTGQDLAIVSDTPGTTTDPVSKAMEILPLGPCLITDTAGLDDEGELGELRVKKTLGVLEITDIAIWVETPHDADRADLRELFLGECRRRNVVVLDYRRGDSVDELKRKIADIKLTDVVPDLLDGLVEKGDRVICVCPIDESAPKGRIILPQVQLIRDCLDRHATSIVCQPAELPEALECLVGNDGRGRSPSGPRAPRRGAPTNDTARVLVVTDSQAFGEVRRAVEGRDVRLTSFSILFARQKGDLAEFLKGVAAVKNLKDGDTVLIAEGCTHHRQCNDIGAVKIPKALAKLSGGKKLNFVFSSGTGFSLESHSSQLFAPGTKHQAPSTNLVVHCGGCMLTRREVLRRIDCAKEAGIPIVNYGILLAAANGLSDVSEIGLVASST